MENKLEFHPIDMETLSKNLKYEHLLVDGMYMRIMNVSKSICIQGATHLKPGFAIMLGS
jgi:predicted acetyltransferase